MTGHRPTGDNLLIVAAAGYGKTTALRRWFPDSGARWISAAEIESGEATLPTPRPGEPVLIDGLSADSTGTDRLIAQICAAPRTGVIAVASRTPLPQLTGSGRFTLIGPAHLALDEAQTADLLASDYGLLDPDLADRLRRATAGWPALVRLGADALSAMAAPDHALARFLADPLGRLHTHVVTEVLAGLPEGVRQLLRDLGDLRPVTPGLCQALGHADARASLLLLESIGVLVNGPAGYGLVPVIAETLSHDLPTARLREASMLAGAWYAVHGPPVSAVRAYLRAGAVQPAAQLLDTHGEALLAAGHADVIIEVLGHGSPAALDRRRQLLLGDALRVAGQVMSAAEVYSLAGPDAADPGLAWRSGLIHYLRGDSRTALATFQKADTTTASADSALLLAWQASAHLQLGDIATATGLARSAVTTATAAGDDGALTTGYVSLALCLSMARDATGSDELLAQALRTADRRGDVVLRARILTSQTYRLLNEARYAEALDAARRTEQNAVAAGHTNLRSIALCNAGDALTMLGRFDEAVRDYERAIALCRRMGSRRSAAAQLGLGEVYRRRGWTEQALAAYELAIRLAEEAGNNQVLVSALAGLARVLATDETKRALHTADRAVELASPGVDACATLARGWVARAVGDERHAAELAAEAAAVARAEGDRATLAGALELRAVVETDARRVRPALREALGIWQAAGATVEAARVTCLLGALPDADTDDRLGALLAGETLTVAGAIIGGERPGLAPPRGRVRIRAFGRFEVLVDGDVVPAAQWQSRKARDLLRVLVARRGRPIGRGELRELLWPDDDPERTGHRLSVLLSIVRGVLDPDRALPSDHYLVADQATVALDLTRIDVDVEGFLADVGHGRRLRDRGAMAQAHALLQAADARYRADVFEDEPYADWAGPLREEARAAYLGALRMLAQTSRAAGDPGAAAGYLLRLLALDPYDEGGHRALIETRIAAGEHGEARRAYARYREAMAAIGVRPSFQYHDPMQVA